jgi:hypothetical protein
LQKELANHKSDGIIAARRLVMKNTISMWTTAIMFVGTLGIASAPAASASQTTYRKPVEITGCLQQGPVAKEYMLKASDGTTWGVNEIDMMMNNYVGQTVTVVGDVMRPTSSERTAGGAHQYLRARDLVVESETCQR